MSKETKLQSRKWTNAAAANVSLATDSPSQSDKPPPTMDTMALICKVTQSFSEVIGEKLSKISETLEKNSTTLESQSKPITVVEQLVSDVEDIVDGLEVILTEAEKKIMEMAVGMDDMENRSRRGNIRVLNLEEGTEGKCPIQFFESWLPTVLGLEASPGTKSRIKIDRAHRSLGPWGAHPRPVVIKLHNSRDKPRIMGAMRAKPNLEYVGKRIFIHQDLSSAVRERCHAFNSVCQALIDKGIRFNMRFPATLTVNHNGTEHKFETRRDAENFLNTLE